MRIGPITASAPIGCSSGPYDAATIELFDERLHRGLGAEKDLQAVRGARAIEQAHQRLLILERPQQISDLIGLDVVEQVRLAGDHDVGGALGLLHEHRVAEPQRGRHRFVVAVLVLAELADHAIADLVERHPGEQLVEVVVDALEPARVDVVDHAGGSRSGRRW